MQPKCGIPSKPVTYNGVTYPSRAEFCRQLGVDDWKVRIIMRRKHCSYVEAAEEALHSQPFFAFVDCRGKEHSSAKKAVRHYGLMYSRVNKLKRDGESIYDAINRVLSDDKLFEFCARPKMSPRAQPVVFDGVSYASHEQCCRALNIKSSTVSSYQCRKNVSFEEAVRAILERRGRRFEIKDSRFAFTDVLGVRHNSISAATVYYNMDYGKLNNLTVRKKRILNLKSMRDALNYVITHPELMEQFRTKHDTTENLDGIIVQKVDKPIGEHVDEPSAKQVAEQAVAEQAVREEPKELVEECVKHDVRPDVKHVLNEKANEIPNVAATEPSAPLVEIVKEVEPKTATLNIVNLDFSKNTLSFMAELLDVWTGLIRKHWLGEELMCDEWRENFREFEHDLQELGYSPDKRILRLNTNRMWRKDNVVLD